MARRPRIPRTVNFGLGFKVRVEWVERLAGRTAEFDIDKMTIRINKATPVWEQYESFAHEVMHAACDFNLSILRDIARPLQEAAIKTEVKVEMEVE
jgi:hypothetical protein